MHTRRGNVVGLLMGLLAGFMVPAVASAHEAYVLTSEQLQAGVNDHWYDVLLPMRNSENGPLIALATVGGLLLFCASYFFWRSTLGQNLAQRLWKTQPLALFILRAALALAVIIGAYKGSIFGPELSVDLLPGSLAVRYGLYGVGVLILMGWLTELAAIALIAVVMLCVWAYGSYALVYLHYLLAALSLLIYGAGVYSLDSWLAGREEAEQNTSAANSPTHLGHSATTPHSASHVSGATPYGLPNTPRALSPAAALRRDALATTGFRLALGVAFVAGAVMVKFLHPAVSLQVAHAFGIFPSNPAFFVAGAALSELALGLFLIMGFQTRTVAAGSLLMLLAAQLYFKEIVWPHLPLYGLSIYLLIAGGGGLTLDHWLKELEGTRGKS